MFISGVEKNVLFSRQMEMLVICLVMECLLLSTRVNFFYFFLFFFRWTKSGNQFANSFQMAMANTKKYISFVLKWAGEWCVSIHWRRSTFAVRWMVVPFTSTPKFNKYSKNMHINSCRFVRLFISLSVSVCVCVYS